MKFLCMACDQQMHFVDRQVPDDGTFAAAFRFRACNFQITMLANPMETRLRVSPDNCSGTSVF